MHYPQKTLTFFAVAEIRSTNPFAMIRTLPSFLMAPKQQAIKNSMNKRKPLKGLAWF
jgi:hypothetical protein